jgi:urease accessory protein
MSIELNEGHGHHHPNVHDPAEARRGRRPAGPPRIGVGGPVGSGKTALIEALVPLLIGVPAPDLRKS